MTCSVCMQMDSIFFGEAKVENIVALKCVLQCFKWYSGLKINFRKSSLLCLGVDEAVVSRLANFLNCEVGKFPFLYLGLPVGARPSEKERSRG